MEQNKEQNLPTTVVAAKQQFELACKEAQGLQIIGNFGAAFQAVNVVSLLKQALTNEVMDAVFMPLMNTKIGFLTDRNGRPNSRGQVKAPYSREIVRDCIIDAVAIGLLPTGNQFNIIAERMYPTKEGYTALLRKLGVKYFIEVSYDKGQTQGFAEIPCKISYKYDGENNNFSIVATVKKDDYSSPDQLRGKAERRAKKALYEYITGCDFGDADEESSRPVDAVAVEITDEANKGGVIGMEAQPTQQQPSAAKAGRGTTAKPSQDPQAGQQAANNNIPGF